MASPDPLDLALADLRRLAQANGRRLTGCTEAELRELEVHAGGPLPRAYRRLMALAGCDAGGFMQGTDWQYPLVSELRAEADELLLEHGLGPLPADLFVFSMHQGYALCGFHLGASDDPHVVAFVHGLDRALRRTPRTFSAWLAASVAQELAARCR
ncbi:SMI1/KNR4 family protein [Nannocystis punicea]|uniref:SMI1/KNR4 family protein n=1 Tax=Nannocystis punicea TaxID=2995304 RepID=A0ABY7H916_9BACT|nr:SMI1/KNR4 family protein [Nannocystis poenicansa]WAS95585.1 SMI1/KNR4 family protein [Nannocystis poenicansa]